MTPKEIVERVKTRRDCSRGEYTVALLCSDIDHLLAIHAAVVEFFEARQGFMSDNGTMIVTGERLSAATKALAALCGWKAEEP